MILAIDSGNTHTVFGCVENGAVVGEVFRISTDRKETDFGYAAKIKQIFKRRTDGNHNILRIFYRTTVNGYAFFNKRHTGTQI